MPLHTASGGISRVRFKRGSQNFTELSKTTGTTNVPGATLLVTSGRLQNVIKYCTKLMRKTGLAGQSQIILLLFNPDSPNVARTFMQTWSTATPDMTSPATSGGHLSKFAKRPEMPPPTALGRLLVARRFACPTNWWASCWTSITADWK